MPDESGRLRQRAPPDEALDGGGPVAQPAKTSTASSRAPHARPGFMASFYRAIGYNYCAFMPRAYTRTTSAEAIGRLPGLRLRGVMTHFAAADAPDYPAVAALAHR